MERKIMHADINNCYASIEILHHPRLRGRPVAVGGDIEARHGIILAKNYEAKAYHIQVGEAIWQAKQRCPELVVVPPNYPLYLRVSRAFRQILSEYTDRLEAFGLDEAWADITHTWRLFAPSPEALIEHIRARVFSELGVTVSIGLADNKIFAKLGSDYKKPNACTVITKDNFKDIVWPLPVKALLGVGPATKIKLNRRGVNTIGQLALTDPRHLQSWLHKWGLILHMFANGLDRSAVENTGNERIIKSVGNSVTAPRDLENEEDCRLIFYSYAESVAERLRELGLQCRGVQISLRDNGLSSFERQIALDRPTDLSSEIHKAAMTLLQTHYHWAKPLRSVGIRAIQLVPAGEPVQISLFEDECGREKRKQMEQCVDILRQKYGRRCIRRAALLTDPAFCALDPRANEEIHPIGYFG